jgi:ATP-dependent RNA helicase DDX41
LIYSINQSIKIKAERRNSDSDSGNKDEDDYVPFMSAAARKRARLSSNEKNTSKFQKKIEDENVAPPVRVTTPAISMKNVPPVEVDPVRIAERKQKEEEERLLVSATAATTRSLISAKERAESIRCTESIIREGWRPAERIEKMSVDEHKKIRSKYHIVVDGEEPLPPPIKRFDEMGIEPELVNALNAKGIKRPTPIQVQGLPVALSGRDLIGVAFTGSGKTVAFTLPLVQLAYQIELRDPTKPGQGPIGILLGPSRELQKQTFDLVQHYFKFLNDTHRVTLRATLAIGGEPKTEQLKPVLDYGIHVLVGTPGRINDFLSQKSIQVDRCTYFCLDEGDRMMDQGFDVEVQPILSHFRHQRQTLLFFATMPKSLSNLHVNPLFVQ